ncbi:MAG TPA: ATP-binding protein, partial [Pirellulaceae bacterium]|nr:ATP-binding protein [Pirellulaceae bacterium]
MYNPLPAAATPLNTLMAYAADLELEVDRLRRREQFLRTEAGKFLLRIQHACHEHSPPPFTVNALGGISEDCRMFRGLLRDLDEPPGYHPAFDQVIDIALRPLVEQVFRWQQRLHGVPGAVLRCDFQSEHLAWFPARLRHILDNLISNSLRYRDGDKGEIRVGLSFQTRGSGYELQLSDNGLGMTNDRSEGALDLFFRAAPARAAGLGVGLAVVKLLVEQCC